MTAPGAGGTGNASSNWFPKEQNHAGMSTRTRRDGLTVTVWIDPGDLTVGLSLNAQSRGAPTATEREYLRAILQVWRTLPSGERTLPQAMGLIDLLCPMGAWKEPAPAAASESVDLPYVLPLHYILPLYVEKGQPLAVVRRIRNGGEDPTRDGKLTLISGAKLPSIPPIPFPAPSVHTFEPQFPGKKWDREEWQSICEGQSRYFAAGPLDWIYATGNPEWRNSQSWVDPLMLRCVLVSMLGIIRFLKGAPLSFPAPDDFAVRPPWPWLTK